MEAPPEIKKRSLPSSLANARKKPMLRKDDEDDEEDVVDEQRLRDIKEQQLARHRKKGVSAESLAKTVKANGAGKSSSGGASTVETMLSSQFSVTVDNGLATTVPHEKIMQQYIDEKLGLTQTAKNSKERGDPDEIYVMPEELKVHATAAKADEEVVSTWSTGIAEVALPASFKIKNISATEQAARKRLDLYSSSHPSATGGERAGDHAGQVRFQVPDQSTAAASDAGGPPRHVSNTSFRPESSSDLKALLDFKKRQMNFRR